MKVKDKTALLFVAGALIAFVAMRKKSSAPTNITEANWVTIKLPGNQIKRIKYSEFTDYLNYLIANKIDHSILSYE